LLSDVQPLLIDDINRRREELSDFLPQPVREDLYNKPLYKFEYKPPAGVEPGSKWFPLNDPLQVMQMFMMVTLAPTRRMWNAFVSLTKEECFLNREGGLASWDVIRRWLTHLPNRMPVYIKEQTITKVVNGADVKVTTKLPFFSLFDIVTRALQMANNLERLYLVPRHGTYASELVHGSLYRQNPLFTKPWLHSNRLNQDVMLGSNVKFLDNQGRSRYGKLMSIFEREDQSIHRVDIDAHKRHTPHILTALRQICTHTCSNNNTLKKGCAFICPDCLDNTTCAQKAGLFVHIRPYDIRPDGDLIAMWNTEIEVSPDNILELINVSTLDDSPFRCEYADLDGREVPLIDLPLHPMDQFDFDFDRLRRLPPDVPVLRLFLTYYYDVSNLVLSISPQ